MGKTTEEWPTRILEHWTKIKIPEGCKEIAVFCDRQNYEREIKNGMKPLMEDDFMPVLIACVI